MAKPVQSVEVLVEELANGWLKDYGLTYFLKNQSINSQIDKALKNAPSKTGGFGGNSPDAKLLIQDSKQQYFPVMIEYKGYKDKLEKLDKDGHVDNLKLNGEPNYKNINDFAVNGAIHYSHSILQHTGFTQAIAIGITGYKDSLGKLQLQIGVYYVAKSNYGMGQKVGEFSDLSFLKPANFDKFVEQIDNLSLSPDELNKIHKKREDQIEDALTRLNERLYGGEQYKVKSINISALARIHLVSASIMANLGATNVTPLEPENLLSVVQKNKTDGEIIMDTIDAFLEAQGIPEKKTKQIINNLNMTLLQEEYSKPVNGESLIKRAFTEVVEDLGYFYKVGLDTDFTGKLFNVMFRWLSFAGDDQNDVVLTPRYVANMMAKLARVNKDSYVWDFAAGSAGLLVASMNEMLKDAKDSIHSPDELAKKEDSIRKYQILGLEVLPEIYMLAVLNMILMGDGSSNILQGDSLDFNGEYIYGRENEIFPADTFILNPPYSASGNGMVFVQKALAMMNSDKGTKKGYAVVIIQDSAGSGKATDYNKQILSQNTLMASIKMPIDIFIGKSNVQTSIYVFKIGEKHFEKQRVRFIDFRNDGYKRSNRKKAKASSNLQDIDNAVERYQEVVDLVLYGDSELKLLTQAEFVEDTICVVEKDTTALNNELAKAKKHLELVEKINTEDGALEKAIAEVERLQKQLQPLLQHNAKIGNDWNFDQHKKIESKPTIADFRKTVSDYLSWEISQLLKSSEPTLGKA